MFINDKEVSGDMFSAQMQRVLAGDETKPVILKADKNISYGTIMAAVEQIKSAGARTIAMAVEKSIQKLSENAG